MNNVPWIEYIVMRIYHTSPERNEEILMECSLEMAEDRFRR